MSKVLRIRTRAGWTTKPSPDLPENRLTAEEVDDTFLTLESDLSSLVSVERFAGGGSITYSVIQTAIDSLTLDGLGLYIPAGTYVIPAASTIELPSGAFFVAHPQAIFVKDTSATTPVISNSDRVSGNSNIRVIGGQYDGNKVQAPAGQRYSTMCFVGISDCSFLDVSVKNGCRKTATSQPYPGAGDGLEIIRGLNITVQGGTFSFNDYDGVKFRNSSDCSLVGAHGVDNSRGLVQITGESGNLLATRSKRIVVTGCSASHSTGNVAAGSQAPYTSGYALHSGSNCVISGNTAYGMLSPCDALEDATDNVIIGNLFEPRSSVGSYPAVWLRQFNSLGCHRNVLRGNTIRPISGSAKVFIHVDGDDNIIENNRILTGDGIGSWKYENRGLRNRWILNHAEPLVSWDDTGSNTVRLELSFTELLLNGLALGAAPDSTAPVLTSPTGTATGATTATGAVTTDEANGTLYWVATANATETSTTVKAGSNQAVSATGVQAISLTGLTAETTYYLHFVHQDAVGNDSTVASSASFTTSSASIDPDIAIISAIEATDAGAQSTTVTDAISAFYASGVSGGWWDKLAAIYGLVGGTADSHAINWIDPDGTRITWSGTVTHSANGVTGGGGHGDTGITAASSVARDNNSLGIYCNAQGANLTFEGIAGAGESGTSGAFHIQQGSNNGIVGRLSSATATSSITTGELALVTSMVAHVLAQRTGASTAAVYRNNIDVTTASPGASDATPVNANILILSRGSAGPTFSGRLAMVYWGQSLSSGERTSLHNAVVALQTALGRNI